MRHELPGLSGPMVVPFAEPANVVGTDNDGVGDLGVLDLDGIGLGPVYQPPRVAYGMAAADFDGDGLPDVVSAVYSPTNVASATQLYLAGAAGVFTQSASFGAQFLDASGAGGYRGRTETVVVADFNNDGAVDIFLPTYTYLDKIHDLSGDPRFVSAGPAPNVYNARQSFLLLNDGTGNFTEHAVEAGVSMHAALAGLQPPSTDPEGAQPEGAQAVDFNMDGLIDLYVAGHLYINQGVDDQGVPHFKDMAPAWGLTQAILRAPPIWNPDDRLPDAWLVTDEGAKFLDWDNDGHLDLLLFRWNWGPGHGARLFEFNGSQFIERLYSPSEPTPTCPNPSLHHTLLFQSTRPYTTWSTAAGINAYDLDNDGLEDVLVSGDASGSAIFHNNGCSFIEIGAGDLGGRPGGGGAMALADLNGSGLIDVIYTEAATHAYYINTTTPAHSPSSFTVEVLGPGGEHNQYGRVIQVFPPGTSQIYTRVVDGGSGYLSQNQYPILVGTPFAGAHTVKVYFAPLTKCMYGGPPCKAAVLSFTIAPGQRALAYAPSPGHASGIAVIVPGR